MSSVTMVKDKCGDSKPDFKAGKFYKEKPGTAKRLVLKTVYKFNLLRNGKNAIRLHISAATLWIFTLSAQKHLAAGKCVKSNVSPRNPFVCGNALLHSRPKSCIMSADNKKGRPAGCYQHPPARMQENASLPHSRYNCACFSLYPFPCVLSRGEMRLCVCSGVGNCKSLRRFCCLTGKPTGDGKGSTTPNG